MLFSYNKYIVIAIILPKSRKSPNCQFPIQIDAP